MALVVAASIILPARATPPSGVSVTPLAPVAQFNEINANATDGGNGLPVITNLPTATNPYTNFSTGRQKFCRLSQGGLEIVSSCRPSLPRYSGCVSDVTRILEAIEHGDPAAAKDLLPLVYEELRRLARSKMAQQSAGHTLQPTALVHEAWLRLVGSERQGWNGRSHFFAAAAEAMRHILVDSARRKRRAKHGGGQERLDVNEVEIAAGADDEKILLVNEALEKLAIEDPIRAEVVKLHYFVGLTHAESAEILQISEKTVRRYWNYARVWLYQTIQSADQPNALHSGKQPHAPAE